MTMYGIEAEDIHKTYNGTGALHGVSIAVRRGELFGLIGPDGAGKTSLIRIMATLLLPDSGRVAVEGLDVVRDYARIRRIIGYMPGKFSLYEDLSVEENLHFFARLFGSNIQENYPLIRDIYTQIEPFRKRRAGKLSGGMKQKLALCCALIHRPAVLLLDEPTTGVDPVSRKEFWDMLDHLKSQGMTILVSTPYMDEAARCDRVALMHQGHILQSASPGEIIAAWDRPLLAVRGSSPHRLLQDLRRQPWAHTVYSFGHSLHLTLNQVMDPAEIVRILNALGHGDTEVMGIAPSIEDCFMELIQSSGE